MKPLFGVKMEGFEQAQKALQLFQKAMEAEKPKLMASFAKIAVRDMKAAIRSGMGGTVPHVSANYQREKSRSGFGSVTLLRTGRYARSISATVTNNGAQIFAKGNNLRKIPNSTIGMWLEYGTKWMPPRPHWRVVALKLQVIFPQMARKSVEKAWRIAVKQAGAWNTPGGMGGR